MAPRITVVGCGYLGATHAACMAELGYEVLGVDIDELLVSRDQINQLLQEVLDTQTDPWGARSTCRRTSTVAFRRDSIV